MALSGVAPGLELPEDWFWLEAGSATSRLAQIKVHQTSRVVRDVPMEIALRIIDR